MISNFFKVFIFSFFLFLSFSLKGQYELGKTLHEIEETYNSTAEPKYGELGDNGLYYVRYDIFKDWKCVFYFKEKNDSSKCIKINKMLPSLGFYTIYKYFLNNGFKNKNNSTWVRNKIKAKVITGQDVFSVVVKNKEKVKKDKRSFIKESASSLR